MSSLPWQTAQLRAPGSLMQACIGEGQGSRGLLCLLPPHPAHCPSAWRCQLSIRQPQCRRLSFLMRYMSHPGTIKTVLLWQNVLHCMFVLRCLSVAPVVPETPVICSSLTAITCSKSLPATQPPGGTPIPFSAILEHRTPLQTTGVEAGTESDAARSGNLSSTIWGQPTVRLVF